MPLCAQSPNANPSRSSEAQPYRRNSVYLVPIYIYSTDVQIELIEWHVHEAYIMLSLTTLAPMRSTESFCQGTYAADEKCLKPNEADGIVLLAFEGAN